MYKAYDERNKFMGESESMDDLLLNAFPSKSFRNEANSYDVYNSDGKREKGTIWTVYNKHFYSKLQVVGCIKRPNLITNQSTITSHWEANNHDCKH